MPRTSSIRLGKAVRTALSRPNVLTTLSAGFVTAGIAVAPAAARAQSTFPPVLELASLAPGFGGDGSTGFIIQGVDEYDWTGISVRGAGDVNGDGLDDVVIGAPISSSGGQAYVLFGRAAGFPPVVALRSLYPDAGGDGSRGFVIGEAVGNLGRSVDGTGDFNGDGIDDLVIGNDNAVDFGGETYVVFGRTTGFPPLFDIGSLYPTNGGDGSTGFILRGISNYDSSGFAVANAGDVNDDGIDDLLIGAAGAGEGRNGSGEAYVVYGRATGFPALLKLRMLMPASGGDGSDGFILRGRTDDSLAGISVSDAGDVNNDGIDDLLVGASRADPPDYHSAGESYLVFGRSAGFPPVFDLESLLPGSGGDGTQGSVVRGYHRSDRVGYSVGSAGDLNGDGVADVFIGSDPGNDFSETYVVFGRSGDDFPATFELRSLNPADGGDGSAGFILRGFRADTHSGRGAGDVNGDGIADLIVGADTATPQDRDNAGKSYVIFGRTTGFPAAFPLANLYPNAGGDGGEGFVLMGIRPQDGSGSAVSGAGDVNGDGIDDLIIGAPEVFNSGPGECYVLFGRGDAKR